MPSVGTKKHVYFFGAGQTEGNATMRAALGGKGANLAEMALLGLPVPPGFTISTEACNAYLASGGRYPDGMMEEVQAALARLEAAMGRRFGSRDNPLLLSVRSGARASMPGMMDTVLNLGLNPDTLPGLIKATRNERFAYDSFRRFIGMFSHVVLGIKSERFEERLIAKKQREGVALDTQLSARALREICEEYRKLVRREHGAPFPDDPREQLRRAIDAVFASWNTERAVVYRRLHAIPDTWGTAVNVQSMVFGNLGPTSGTGVAFTRNPSTGEKRFFGEFLLNAQGEDVVAGIRTPLSLEELRNSLPQVNTELEEVFATLERHYRDMQDIEFTIQDGTLYLLQTRTGKRTAAAAVRVAVEMVEEGLIEKKTAVRRIETSQIEHLLHPTIDPRAAATVIAKGLPASPGAAVGRVVFSAAEAVTCVASGEKVILVRSETSPDDISGMHAAEGILTATGGMTSHAAVVARGMGKCCVAGCTSVEIDPSGTWFSANGNKVNGGDYISLNGTTGEVLLGRVELVEPQFSDHFVRLMAWADEFARLGVRTNADTPRDAEVARNFGAQGIGLCRTEHMFFQKERVNAMREMILSTERRDRERALAKIRPMQKGDFKEIFQVMQGLPVTVRLLDPPLHEFLPHADEECRELAAAMNMSQDELRLAVDRLREANPMLGHRGCRLGISHPEIYDMQVAAVFEAACELAKEGVAVLPEIMIPLVGHVRELEITRRRAEEAARQVMERLGVQVEYKIGTMIELPRAAITADEIAPQADFFSFGTNDLTQTTFGISRDDAGTFLPRYREEGILPDDPFVTIDQGGVGVLVRWGIERGRAARPNLKLGICGEHGGDPKSIAFCHAVGLDYVSCSPFRVPIARLAAAHAALHETEGVLEVDR
ncbi:MAG: pyruvate, phosphate dikinase [Candidatus Tectomicrobia bacterium]|nr:pyruvate, phosphate dikinase [Candidatus Tectomicrobia bacterium]